ncbi:50S ribosomal protein L9 [Jiella pacifica]|uniref:Large ribosomal subunit protein bL9 n=1 Tax=Jiella pacifica TaxID=2696469 RepID=A0A6N9T6Q2_9HYPH|nr:50S ribosomal protein L9 [Jiella pacifica]NDW05746.1 50S ribosomal protein L9 [Jiella pacifica]
MQVILLERIARLGQMGDTVRVRDGYARNYLLPTGRALRANEANRTRFEAQKAQLIQRNEERKTEARGVAETLNGRSFIVVRSAGETGQLYGSVSTRDIAEILANDGFKVGRNQVELNQPIKAIGLHTVEVSLHPEVTVEVQLNIARSPDEAERQARGEDLSSADAIYGSDQPDYALEDEAEEDENEADVEGETEVDEPAA